MEKEMGKEMEKVHTIVAFFAAGDESERGGCFVAHFARRCDAVAAFREKMSECGNCRGETEAADELYGRLEGDGSFFDAADGTRFFIRAEPLRTGFGEGAKGDIAWN